MDDLGGIIGGLIGGLVVLYIIIELLKFLYKVLLYVVGNIIALFDILFGAWKFLPPFMSWAIVGLFTGALLYFAVIEADKLSRPAVRPILIIAACLFLVLPVLF